MDTDIGDVPAEVHREIGGLVQDLSRMGARVRRAVYTPDTFGNWLIDFDLAGFTFRLVKDRGQYRVDDVAPDLLHGHGLWQAFAHRPAFEQAVREWAAARPWQ